MTPVAERKQVPRRAGAQPSGEAPNRALLGAVAPGTIADRRGKRLTDTGSPLDQWVAVLGAAMRPDDVERLRADAELAVEQLTPGSYFRSAAQHVLELAPLLAGNEGSAGATAAPVRERSDGEDLETIRFRVGRAAGLTAAELRLLPLLATHLSLRGIGERLFISPNTVKTEAISVYRKLGVSSRSEAVERAAELGLIEATVATGAREPSRGPAVRLEQLSQLTRVAVAALVAGGPALRSEALVPASPKTKAVA